MLNSNLSNISSDLTDKAELEITTNVQFSAQGQSGFKTHDLGTVTKSGYKLISLYILRSDTGVAGDSFPAFVEISGGLGSCEVWLHTYGNAIFNGTIVMTWCKV